MRYRMRTPYCRNAFIVFLLVALSLASPGMACSQEELSLDIADILSRIGTDVINVDVIDGALPRLTDESIVLRLRGGDPLALRGSNLREESNQRKCFIIAAYLNAAFWDWSQFRSTVGHDTLFGSIKFAMEHYLVNINHRLNSIGVDEDVVLKVDRVKGYFSASPQEEPPDFAEVDEFLETLLKEIRAFALTKGNYEVVFMVAGWLVWEAQLANLCLSQKQEKAKYLREVMNLKSRTVNLTGIKELASEILGTNGKARIEDFGDSLNKVGERFPLKDRVGVESTRDEIMRIFSLLDLRFPSLKA